MSVIQVVPEAKYTPAFELCIAYKLTCIVMRTMVPVVKYESQVVCVYWYVFQATSCAAVLVCTAVRWKLYITFRCEIGRLEVLLLINANVRFDNLSIFILGCPAN